MRFLYLFNALLIISWKLEDDDDDDDEAAVGRMWDMRVRARSLFVLEGMIAGSKIGGQRGTLQALTQGAPPHGLGVGTILPEERVGPR